MVMMVEEIHNTMHAWTEIETFGMRMLDTFFSFEFCLLDGKLSGVKCGDGNGED